MIENYIQEVHVVTPVPNPKFNPKFYLPENIGLTRAQQKVVGMVAGWKAGGTCTIGKGDGTLVVESTGGDPYVSVRKLKTVSGGPFTVGFRMKSRSSGKAVVYYNKPGKARTVPFAAKHDGKWHSYRVKIPVSSLNGLRLDPSVGAGRIEFDWVRLEDSSGQRIHEWNF